MMTKLFSLSFFAGSLSLFAVACGGAPTSSDAAASSADQAASVDSQFQSCHTDDDCVAVPRAGCCHNGWLEAVASDQVDAYDAAHVCNEAIACPMYIVNDTRVAECNNTRHQCEMVAIDQIACGGFVRNAHACPNGYDCQLPRQYGGDVPGTCAQHTDGTTGGATCGGIAGLQCPDGQTCNYDDPNCDPANGGADCSGHCQ